MTRVLWVAGLVVLGGAWVLAATGHSFTAHMTSHMAAVSVAAPLIALGVAGGRFDPAARWPRVVTPLPMMLVELAVVWGWHMPALRTWAAESPYALALEQSMFAAAGLLLWSACLGTRDAGSSTRRAAGILALLLTTMHMTLLGVLVALAPRLLFAHAGPMDHGSLTPMADQQLGGVTMLVIGAGSYLLGGLALLSRVLASGPSVTEPP